MNLYNVQCRQSSDGEDAEPRTAVTIASSAGEAARLIRDYTEVTAELVAKDRFPGPAKFLGFTGQKGPWRT
jgi:hypothetical protein